MEISSLATDSCLLIQNLSLQRCTDTISSLPVDLSWNFAINRASYFNIYVKIGTCEKFQFIAQCANYSFRIVKSYINSSGITDSETVLLFKVQPVLNSGLKYLLADLPSVRYVYQLDK